MFDYQIQQASTADLERRFAGLKWACNAGEIDLGIRIAKELRSRNRRTDSQSSQRLRLTLRMER